MQRTGFHTPFRKAAFTLLELLVVIVIVTILAGLGLAVSGSVRKASDRAKCLANLRTVGAAIGSYMGEHDGYLPGPLTTWQSCWYDDNDSGACGKRLAPYLGIPLDWEKRKMEAFVCPAWQRGAPYREDASFILNTEVLVNGQKLNPWGDADLAYSDAGPPVGDPNEPDKPKMFSRLSDLPLARTWAIQDLDALFPVAKKPGGIASKPVHGDVRNALFFDFHAESVKLDFVP